MDDSAFDRRLLDPRPSMLDRELVSPGGLSNAARYSRAASRALSKRNPEGSELREAAALLRTAAHAAEVEAWKQRNQDSPDAFPKLTELRIVVGASRHHGREQIHASSTWGESSTGFDLATVLTDVVEKVLARYAEEA